MIAKCETGRKRKQGFLVTQVTILQQAQKPGEFKILLYSVAMIPVNISIFRMTTQLSLFESLY